MNNSENKVTAGRVVHLVLAIVLLVLATIAFILTMVMGTELVRLAEVHSNATDAGEQLGAGLGKVFVVVFMIIFAVACEVLSIIGVVVSSTVWRFRLGGERIFGIVSTVLNGIYILLGVLIPVILLLSGNT